MVLSQNPVRTANTDCISVTRSNADDDTIKKAAAPVPVTLSSSSSLLWTRCSLENDRCDERTTSVRHDDDGSSSITSNNRNHSMISTGIGTYTIRVKISQTLSNTNTNGLSFEFKKKNRKQNTSVVLDEKQIISICEYLIESTSTDSDELVFQVWILLRQMDTTTPVVQIYKRNNNVVNVGNTRKISTSIIHKSKEAHSLLTNTVMTCRSHCLDSTAGSNTIHPVVANRNNNSVEGRNISMTQKILNWIATVRHSDGLSSNSFKSKSLLSLPKQQCLSKQPIALSNNVSFSTVQSSSSSSSSSSTPLTVATVSTTVYHQPKYNNSTNNNNWTRRRKRRRSNRTFVNDACYSAKIAPLFR